MTRKRELNLEPTDAVIKSLGADKVAEFWARVKKGRGCWLFATTDPSRGYGRIFAKKRYHKAHRVSWMLHHGPIPKGLGVLHRCDNPPCVRPSHLFLGNQKANWEDMIAKGRGNFRRGERHPMTGLTDEAVREIRRLHIRGKHSHDPGNTSELMNKFGISRNTVLRVADGVNWRHVK